VIDLPAGLPVHIALFSESPSRMIVTTRDEAALRALADRHRVPIARLGTVGGDRLTIHRQGTAVLDEPMASLHAAWTGLERALGKR